MAQKTKKRVVKLDEVELEQLVVDQKLTFGMDISKYKLDT